MNDSQIIKPEENMQMMSTTNMHTWYDQFVQFSKEIMKKGLDYGEIPGVNKPSLFKPGAEKLRVVYGLSVKVDQTDSTVDIQAGYVDYTYKATVLGKNGQILAECEGNCNSYETKFRYLWIKEQDLPENIDKSKLKKRSRGGKAREFQFAINKGETTGQYGKPKEHWEKWKAAIESGQAVEVKVKSKSGRDLVAYEMGEEQVEYRIDNPDVIGLKNTIMKMAQKRAFVGAVLIATGASEFYTQDVEDMEQFQDVAASVDGRATTPVTENKTVEEGEVVTETNATPSNSPANGAVASKTVNESSKPKANARQKEILTQYVSQGRYGQELLDRLNDLSEDEAKELVNQGLSIRPKTK